MKTKLFILLILECVAGISCNNTTPANKCGPCPEYPVFAPFLEIKIVDKTTGGDLFLAPASPYKFSDLVVTSSIGGSVTINADTIQTSNRFARILCDQSQVFILKLAALKADTMNVVAKMDSPKCCPRFAIKQITLNNALVCNPCSLTQLITIKK